MEPLSNWFDQVSDWMVAHQKELATFAGKHVAISVNGVVATGDDLDQVRENLQAKGISEDEIIFSNIE